MRKLGTAVLVVGMLAGAGTVLSADGASAVEPAPASGATDWKQITAGRNHTCAVKATGRAYCWGYDGFGELGNDAANSDNVPTPVEVAGSSTKWKQIDAGDNHTCAVKTNARAFCWGDDGAGQLGDDTVNLNQPTPVGVVGENWKQVTASKNHSCGVKENGRAFCWGSDFGLQLGDDENNANKPTPVPVAGGAKNWKQLSAGEQYTCGVKTNGRAYCWGFDGAGKLGNDVALDSHGTPVQVAGGATDWKQISTGGEHTCAVKTNRRAFCWGGDDDGRLGDGATIDSQPTPVVVAGATTDWKYIAAGAKQTCAVKTDGRAFCWGDDEGEQLGDGSPPSDQATPVEVDGGFTNWKQTAAGNFFHSCGVRTDGRAFCWGNDGNGELGDDANFFIRPAPAELAG